jgi:hypothetical protein
MSRGGGASYYEIEQPWHLREVNEVRVQIFAREVVRREHPVELAPWRVVEALDRDNLRGLDEAPHASELTLEVLGPGG